MRLYDELTAENKQSFHSSFGENLRGVHAIVTLLLYADAEGFILSEILVTFLTHF